MDKVDKRAGGKWVIPCNSRRAGKVIYDWGVIEYPDIEACQTKVQELEKLDWGRCLEARTILEIEADLFHLNPPGR